ncbi:MAG: hypothetical protein JRH08_18255 [Deltaproteobacteria bacterium]|nr:hypothetical protein [Deltaproteobacteria bacterium]
MAGGASIARVQVVPHTRLWRYSNLRLCLTSFAVATVFLGVASWHLGHLNFQIACLVYLLKSYFLTLLLAMGGLTLMAVIAYFIKRESDEDLAERYKLIAFFVPAMMLINLAYFSLKVGSVAFSANHPAWPAGRGLIAREQWLWWTLRPLFAHLPAWGYHCLDLVYTGAWFASLSALPLSLIFLKPSRAVKLNCAVMLLLAFTALGNVLLLTYSPIYEFPRYFSYLPADLSTWKIHHASLALTHKLINLKAAFFASSSPGFFQPVAAFPAFHTSYAFLLFLAFRDRRYIKFLFLLFFVLVVAGGIVLGYHGYRFSKVPICRGGDCGVIDRACLEQAARRTARVVTPYSPIARTVARASTTEPAFYKAGKEEFLQCPTPQSLL